MPPTQDDTEGALYTEGMEPPPQKQRQKGPRDSRAKKDEADGEDAPEPVQTVTQRNAALRGFAAAVYRVNDLMRGVLDARSLQEMHIRIVDRGYARPSAEGVMTNEPEDPAASQQVHLDKKVGGRAHEEVRVETVEEAPVAGEQLARVLHRAQGEEAAPPRGEGGSPVSQLQVVVGMGM